MGSDGAGDGVGDATTGVSGSVSATAASAEGSTWPAWGTELSLTPVFSFTGHPWTLPERLLISCGSRCCHATFMTCVQVIRWVGQVSYGLTASNCSFEAGEVITADPRIMLANERCVSHRGKRLRGRENLFVHSPNSFPVPCKEVTGQFSAEHEHHDVLPRVVLPGVDEKVSFTRPCGGHDRWQSRGRWQVNLVHSSSSFGSRAFRVSHTHWRSKGWPWQTDLPAQGSDARE